MALRLIAGGIERRVDLFQVFQQTAGFFIVLPSFRRHGNTPRGALQEGNPKMRFQLLNGFAEGGVGHIQRVRGAGKAAGFDNASEGFES